MTTHPPPANSLPSENRRSSISRTIISTLACIALLQSACSGEGKIDAAGVDATEAANAAPATNEQAHFSMDDFALIEKIDAHVHLNTEDPAFMQQATADRFRLISINVDYPDFPALETQRSVALHWQAENSHRFQFAATFSMHNWNEKNWSAGVIQSVDDAVSQGAIGVKVWKNIGMDYRDDNGELVMIDDEGFDQVLSHMKDIGLPLIGHQGEPKNCWLPLEEMTVNNDRAYFAAHPQYHMFLHPEFPSYEEQMGARNRMLDKNMGLSFMGAHMASLEWSVDELAVFLDRYPNAVIDLAARMGQVQYQSGLDRQKVRQFLIDYQDRILYASDLTSQPGDSHEDAAASIHTKWLNDWRYLNSEEQFSVPEVDHLVVGLALPKAVAEKIYRVNAEKFFAMKTN